MRTGRARRWPRAFLVGALAAALLDAGPGSAEEPAAPRVDWESGKGASYLVPALETGGFVVGLNQFDRHLIDRDEYGTDGASIWKNLTSAAAIDHDPFSVNQLGHPYQGSIYYGFARSAGLTFWQSLLYSLGGSFLWETAGETSPPSLNDHVASGIGGAFLGEPLFRMASLLLESGGDKPGFWRELGATLLSPPTGFNRLVFGERFAPVFPSRHPAVFLRLSLGATLGTDVATGGLTTDVRRPKGRIEYAMTYGLPGKPGYGYMRPFDYFQFELTAVPDAKKADDAIENLSIRGLLAGTGYELGDEGRGLWGLFGGFDYLSPQIFRVSTTALSAGTVAQWWLSRRIALQTTVMGGLGFGAAGTAGDPDERDYHYGLVPQGLVGLRLIFGDRALLETTGRGYLVAGTGEGGGVRTSDFGGEVIGRASLGVTVRLFGPHAIGLQLLVSSRDTHFPGGGLRRSQSIETITLAYTVLGPTRFGAVEWRSGESDLP